MFETITALFNNENVLLSSTELMAPPKQKILVLSGLISLKKYIETKKAFSGGEAKQIKELLKQITAGKAIVEVNANPSMQHGKEMGYLFFITQKFASKKEKQKEIRKLVKQGIVEEYVFPVKTIEHAHEE